MALLVLAVSAGLEVEVVHVDHGLRPGSGAEGERVAALAEELGATFRSERVVVEPGGDLEARCRAARRSVVGADALTGHTADDQAETLLINLLRGAAVPGLGAMRPGPTKPLLALRRHETRGLCEALGLDVLDDPMNDDRRFVRNRIRHDVLPLLDDVADRDVVPLLNRTADHARSVADHLDVEASTIDPTDVVSLRTAPDIVASAALRRWLRAGTGHPPTSAELGRVMAVVRGEVVACEISDGRRIARTAGRLRVETT